MLGPDSELEIDLLFVADRAEVINGKLYVMGGAWDQFMVADFHAPIRMSIAVAVLVPWQATNQHHELVLRIQDADARDLASIPSTIVLGRPPHLEVGTIQRVSLAVPDLVLRLPGPGVYVVAAWLNQVERRRVTFRAIQSPRPQSMPQSPTPPI